MLRFLLYIPAAIITLYVGIFIVPCIQGITGSQEPEPVILKDAPASDTTDSVREPESTSGDCDGFDGDGPDLKPMIRAWLRGVRFENEGYCSDTLELATSYNPTKVVTPSYIDLNRDGQEELVLKTLCSATGNCSMHIFEKHGRSFRRIFTDAHGTQMFGLKNTSRYGRLDIWTRMHGSWNSGDMVLYRFDGRQYKPTECFEYEYEDIDHDGTASNHETLKKFSCSRFSN